jgi:hypothetical protein
MADETQILWTVCAGLTVVAVVVLLAVVVGYLRSIGGVAGPSRRPWPRR